MIDDATLKNIESLHRLKTEGVITEEDFEKAKNELLSGPRRPQPKPRPTAQASSAKETELPADDDYIGWMTLPLSRYADFAGRSSRKEFWLFLLLINLALCGLVIVARADTDRYGELGDLGNIMFGLIALGLLAVIIPYIAVQVRRFHDQDMSGLFALFNLIPLLGPILVLIMMLLEGTQGDNRFGPDPVQREALE